MVDSVAEEGGVSGPYRGAPQAESSGSESRIVAPAILITVVPRSRSNTSPA